MTPVTHQLTFRVHCEQDASGSLKLDAHNQAIPRLNRKGRRKLEALKRRKRRRF